MNQKLDHHAILNNRARLEGVSPTSTETDCGDPLVFALQDQHHSFSLGLNTLLQCLQAAEQEAAIPELPGDWWSIIARRFAIPLSQRVSPKQEACDDDHLVFALQDQHHQFSIDISTILQCLHIAEQEGAVPQLPELWWIFIRNRYPTHHGLPITAPFKTRQGTNHHDE